VWIDPKRIDDVEAAITREEIRKLIHEGVIKSLSEKGVSRARARILHEKKGKGLRRGSGSKSGAVHAKISKKEAWMSKIRALRKRLRELKTNRTITESTYRKLYTMANSGRFESVADMERYLKTHELWRKR
jgi:large subunit ribosomal protein L19e